MRDADESDLAQSSFIENDSEPPPPKVVVRLETTMFQTKRGLVFQKRLNFLTRKCQGFNFVKEDMDQGGVDSAFKRIENLHEVKDGIYEIVMCNESKDWETGYLDDWDFRLVKYEEKKKG